MKRRARWSTIPWIVRRRRLQVQTASGADRQGAPLAGGRQPVEPVGEISAEALLRRTAAQQMAAC
eukprot:8908799-Pyramimonas_sp.AAC.1